MIAKESRDRKRGGRGIIEPREAAVRNRLSVGKSGCGQAEPEDQDQGLDDDLCQEKTRRDLVEGKKRIFRTDGVNRVVFHGGSSLLLFTPRDEICQIDGKVLHKKYVKMLDAAYFEFTGIHCPAEHGGVFRVGGGRRCNLIDRGAPFASFF
jgi:hypothetical protein